MMYSKPPVYRYVPLILLVSLLAPALFGWGRPPWQAAQAHAGSQIIPPPGQPQAPSTIYLPSLIRVWPWRSPFGFESSGIITSGSKVAQHAAGLGHTWARLNDRISWKDMQPIEDGPINFAGLQAFEQELLQLQGLNITPLVIVDEYPEWAVQPGLRSDGLTPTCGALQPAKYADFAAFMDAILRRYAAPPYNVHNWEMGNEPDVDPNLVPADSVFGCWGDIRDPYYGGRAYGEMLLAVAPAMRSADPNVVIWLGGLLMDAPVSSNPDQKGHPERFFEGVLETGAAPAFDVVSFHWYPPFVNLNLDYDNQLETPWKPLGGGVAGKANILHNLMVQYGVSKPVFLNETAITCPDEPGSPFAAFCDPPVPAFYEMQADYIVRTSVRGLSNGISGYMWYTLQGPGWRNSGLLDRSQNPQPAFTAYANLTRRLSGGKLLGPVDFGPAIEAYAFSLPGKRVVTVMWAKMYDEPGAVSIPAASFIAAYDRQGNLLTPTLDNGAYTLAVSFAPVYVETTQQ